MRDKVIIIPIFGHLNVMVAEALSRCYTLKLLAETCVQRRCEQVSQSGVTR